MPRHFVPIGGFLCALVLLAGCGEQREPPVPDPVFDEILQAATGVPVDGYPNYHERLMLMAINRGRSDPNNVPLETAKTCSNWFAPSAPLLHHHDTSRSERFHAANCALNDGGLSHGSYCTVASDIATTFESTCDGSLSCSCNPGTDHFNCTTGGGSGTDPFQRCGRFNTSCNGEVLAAGYQNGWEAVKGWITECPPPDDLTEGHRRILVDADSTHTQIGLGYFVDSGNACPWGGRYYGGSTRSPGVTRPVLPAGAHRPETGGGSTTFTFYVNYYEPGGGPNEVTLVLDGTCHAMSREIGTDANGTWIASMQVGSGCHEYYFMVRDSTNAQHFYPETGSYGVGNCTDYDTTVTSPDCGCTPGESRPCGLGKCAGTETCNVSGGWDPCDGPPPDPTESCNGIDDDCDGSVPANEADDDSDGHRICDGDCDDNDPDIYPGAPEGCNGDDNDCDGSPAANEADADSDGHRICAGDCDDTNSQTHPGAAEQCDGGDNDCDGSTPANESDNDLDGYRPCSGDCDDGNAAMNPGESEVCDGLDNDCSGSPGPGEVDADGDSYMVCQGDCDDTSPGVNPGASETCNGDDDDCDGSVPPNEADGDTDGFRICAGDCDDANGAVYPGATEACNDIDDNCDGATDEGCSCTDGATRPCGTEEGECEFGTQTCSGGTWGACQGGTTPIPEVCNGADDDCDGDVPANEVDGDFDGFRICEGDCDDAQATVNPDATEACDGLDTDCDGSVPPGEADDDADGYRVCAGDCDDGNAAMNPGASESCDGLDNDCDGSPGADEADADADGHRICDLDCDDGNADVYPGATEQCNTIDDNCDGATDEGCTCTDSETRPCGSDVGACDPGTQTCAGGTWGTCQGSVEPVAEACNGLDDDCDGDLPADEADADGDGTRGCEGDCDDGDAAVHPGMAEVCNGVDDDCDGALPADEADADLDGIRVCAGDCDDTRGTVHPGAAEACNGTDDDCDGTVDEDCPCNEGESRPCGTDEGACTAGAQTCTGGAWGGCDGEVGPVTEICDDAVDNDCDGETDEGCGGPQPDGGVDGGGQPTGWTRIKGGCGCTSPSGAPPASCLLLLGMLFLIRRRA